MKHGGARPGAGRPRTLSAPVKIQLNVEAKQLREIDRRAKRRHVDRSTYLRMLLADALAND